MRQVQDDQPVRVRLLARQSHALSSGPGRYIRVVDTHVHGVVVGVDEPAALSGALGDVLHIAICRVGILLFHCVNPTMVLSQRITLLFLTVKKSNMEKN